MSHFYPPMNIQQQLKICSIDTDDDRRISKDEFTSEKIKPVIEKWVGKIDNWDYGAYTICNSILTDSCLTELSHSQNSTSSTQITAGTSFSANSSNGLFLKTLTQKTTRINCYQNSMLSKGPCGVYICVSKNIGSRLFQSNVIYFNFFNYFKI